jgi:hypothetical protein
MAPTRAGHSFPSRKSAIAARMAMRLEVPGKLPTRHAIDRAEMLARSAAGSGTDEDLFRLALVLIFQSGSATQLSQTGAYIARIG